MRTREIGVKRQVLRRLQLGARSRRALSCESESKLSHCEFLVATLRQSLRVSWRRGLKLDFVVVCTGHGSTEGKKNSTGLWTRRETVGSRTVLFYVVQSEKSFELKRGSLSKDRGEWTAIALGCAGGS